jgi:chromosome segregation ATPase
MFNSRHPNAKPSFNKPLHPSEKQLTAKESEIQNTRTALTEESYRTNRIKSDAEEKRVELTTRIEGLQEALRKANEQARIEKSELGKQQAATQQQLDETEQQLLAARELQTSTQQQLDEAETKLLATQQQQVEAQRLINETRTTLDEKVTIVEELKHRLAKNTADFHDQQESTGRTIASLREMLEGTQQESVRLEEDLMEARRELEIAQEQIPELETEGAALKERVDALQSELTDVKQEKSQLQHQLEESVQKQQIENQASEEKIAALRRELENARQHACGYAARCRRHTAMTLQLSASRNWKKPTGRRKNH